jgi:hypothetical protein
MRKSIGAVLAAALVCGIGLSARADGDKDATAIVDKGIQALGGADKLSKIKVLTWKSKGKINLGDADNDFNSQVTAQGLDHFRQDFEGEFGGMKIKGTVVLNGDKGWREFGGNTMELDKDSVANEKRSVYLQMVPITLLPLKGKDFKIQTAGEEKIDGKAAPVLKVTGPDGKDFKLYFDKESGLPVKMVAKVVGFMGEEFTQESTFSKYKEFGGIKKATELVSLRDGQKFIHSDVTEFSVLDKVDPKVFSEPK